MKEVQVGKEERLNTKPFRGSKEGKRGMITKRILKEGRKEGRKCPRKGKGRRHPLEGSAFLREI
jgi:hypothetical protein